MSGKERRFVAVLSYCRRSTHWAADFAYEFTVDGSSIQLTHLTVGAEDVTGYSLAELYRPDALDLLLGADESRRLEHLLMQSRAETHPPGELKLRRRDGTYAWVEYRSGPWLVDGQHARIIGAARDITARKIAEESLRRHVAILSAINSSSPDLIYLKDVEGCYVYANPAYAAALGLRPVDILHRRAEDLLAPSAADTVKRMTTR
nr:PAS domain-containing protein [Burkholderia sp. WP9]